MLRSYLVGMLLAAASSCGAQGTWDMKYPGNQSLLAEKCGECLAALKNRPKEVQFGLFTDDQNDVWFVLSDPAFFDVLFKRASDGIAVDIVPRENYACGGSTAPQTTFNKGQLLKPVYLSELRKSQSTGFQGNTGWKVGHLTTAQAQSTHELNLVLLKDRHVCYYNSFYDLARYRWDLLNMGMYMDTLTYGGGFDTTQTQGRTSVMRRRELHFTIPFEKNKSTYSQQDLQPLYDSLRLTDFNIKRIDIEAFSSVEGPEARNIELQRGRAQSIVQALQAFQSPSIETHVNASENWVEFLRDVLLTSQAHLAGLPKSDVKEKLKDKRVAEQLEPVLSLHRKALITLELTRKDGLAALGREEVVKRFEQAIANRNIAQARALQNAVYERIIDGELPSSFLDGLQVPAQREFADLINSRIAFKHFQDPRDALETYRALQELQRMQPEDAHIAYNLCAVTFRVWMLDGQVVDPVRFKRDIEDLRKKGIDEPLVLRMLVNHAILMAESHMYTRDYAKKDERMDYIHRNYGKLTLTSEDHLSLAQYFASYANFDKSIKVVKPLVTSVDCAEDILFYYLNLTIFDPDQTKKADYRSVVSNAVSKNKQRFCDLFLPYGHGGITFQLLDDPILKKMYCESCE